MIKEMVMRLSPLEPRRMHESGLREELIDILEARVAEHIEFNE